jgi:hypothetical protein
MKLQSSIYLVLLCLNLAEAQDLKFSSFKISPEFKKRLSGDLNIYNTQTKDSAKKIQAIEKGMPQQAQSIMYQKLNTYMSKNHQQIGKTRINELLNFNRNFDLGQQNFSGFNWQRPMGFFKVNVNRSIAPDLFDEERWIVTDKMVIEVEAKTYLEKLLNENLISISQNTLNAYAGIIFKRTYRYQHFAASFEKGIKSDLSKLFLGFTRLNPRGIQRLDNYEFVSRKDFLSFKVGAQAGLPLGYGFELRGDALLKFDLVNSLSVQAVGESDKNRLSSQERYRINSSKQKTSTQGVTATLQIDFFKLLQIHLLSYEFRNEIKKSKSIHLSLSGQELAAIIEDADSRRELRRMMYLYQEKVEFLKKFVVSYEYRRKQNLSSKYSIFHFEGLMKKGNETFQFYSDNGRKQTHFHRYNYSNDKVLQTWLGKLINSVLVSLFNFDMFKQVKAAKYTRLFFEYNSDKKISIDSNLYLDDESKLSSNLEKEIFIRKYAWPIRKKLHRELTRFSKNYTFLPKNLIQAIEQQKLSPPIRINSRVTLMKSAYQYFNQLPTPDFFKYVAKLCRSRKVKEWENPTTRQRLIQVPTLNRRESCVRKIGRKFLSYREVLATKNKMDLNQLNKIVTMLHNKIDDVDYLRLFFGDKNIFVSGILQAKSQLNTTFTSYFKFGEFQGNGIIDKFVREQGLSSN